MSTGKLEELMQSSLVVKSDIWLSNWLMDAVNAASRIKSPVGSVDLFIHAMEGIHLRFGNDSQRYVGITILKLVQGRADRSSIRNDAM